MATVTQNADRNSTGGWFFAAVLIVAALLIVGPLIRAVSTGAVPLPQQAPARENIIYRPHAVEKHGADALAAEKGVSLCSDANFRQRPLNGTTEGWGWVMWCETGEPLCPCVYLTLGNKEKTAFIRACVQLRNPKKGRGEW